MTRLEQRAAWIGSLVVIGLIASGVGHLALPMFAMFMLVVTGSMWLRNRNHRQEA